LEVSLELILLNMNKDFVTKSKEELLAFLKRESEYSLLSELCGLIGLDTNGNYIYRKMQNRSKNPNHYFIIDPYDYLNFIKKYMCFAVFHSHLICDESPSDFDKKTSENCCYAFIIYSINTEKFFIYEPEFKDYNVNIIEGIRSLL
jgi:proteasome lid subunit RPN8/RPN11